MIYYIYYIYTIYIHYIYTIYIYYNHIYILYNHIYIYVYDYTHKLPKIQHTEFPMPASLGFGIAGRILSW